MKSPVQSAVQYSIYLYSGLLLPSHPQSQTPTMPYILPTERGVMSFTSQQPPGNIRVSVFSRTAQLCFQVETSEIKQGCWPLVVVEYFPKTHTTTQTNPHSRTFRPEDLG